MQNVLYNLFLAENLNSCKNEVYSRTDVVNQPLFVRIWAILARLEKKNTFFLDNVASGIMNCANYGPAIINSFFGSRFYSSQDKKVFI